MDSKLSDLMVDMVINTARNAEPGEFREGDKVKLADGATIYSSEIKVLQGERCVAVRVKSEGKVKILVIPELVLVKVKSSKEDVRKEKNDNFTKAYASSEETMQPPDRNYSKDDPNAAAVSPPKSTYGLKDKEESVEKHDCSDPSTIDLTLKETEPKPVTVYAVMHDGVLVNICRDYDDAFDQAKEEVSKCRGHHTRLIKLAGLEIAVTD